MAEHAALSRRIDAVVIGTSAGGVEALSIVLGGLRGDTAVAVLAVLHLPKDRRSLLPEILGRKCALPVQEAVDKEPIAPGTVYLAPPDYHLLVDDGPRLALSIDEPVHYSRPSIDVLFESAADAYGERLMGIVLTGANQDGAAGLLAVQQAGGVTVVQDPQTAHAALMPTAAMQRVRPDHVLTLEGIAALLRHLPTAPEPAP